MMGLVGLVCLILMVLRVNLSRSKLCLVLMCSLNAASKKHEKKHGIVTIVT
jgi:hypothetical protein